ncbi:MAG: TolC family outer membrane protein [Pseudomonadota bacterium]
MLKTVAMGRLRAGCARIVVVAGLAVAGMPAALQAETLADTLAAAYDHSGLLEQNRAVLRAADEDVAQAVALLRPVIDYTARVGLTAGNVVQTTQSSASLEIAARLLLWDGGATRLRAEIQKETVLSTRQGLISVEQTVLLNAVTAYMSVREALEFVALRENNVRLITQELRAAEDRFEVGEVTRTDVALAESRLAAARSLLASARGSLTQSVATFQEAVGRRPGPLAAPKAAPKLPPNVSSALAIARRTHPQILQAQHDITAAELTLARANKALNPTLSASGSVTFADGDQRTDQVGLTLSGPISQGGALASQIRQAQARLDGQRANLHVIRHSIDAAVEIAYANLAVAAASREASIRQITAARVAFRGVREEATLGARTTLDVLDAEQELLDAQASLISAEAQQTVAAYTVLSAIGMLTVSDLGLHVQQYDPAAYYNLVKRAPQTISDQGTALDRVLKSLGKN